VAKFLVLSEDKNRVYIRNCVRIAKKSLIFDEPVNGKTQVPKERCYYYNDAEHADYLYDLQRLDKRIRNLIMIRDDLLSRFTQVTTKSTRF